MRLKIKVNPCVYWGLLVFFIFSPREILAQEEVPSSLTQEMGPREDAPVPSAEMPNAEKISSKDLVRKSWATSHQGDLAKLDEYAQLAMALYGEAADQQQSQLTGFPERGKVSEYQALNDVATILFIRAEAYMNYGKTEPAKQYFEEIIARFSWAQSWDPRVGAFWSVAEKSQDSINVILGNFEEKEPEIVEPVRKTLPNLHQRGTQQVIDYTRFGQFENVGNNRYSYSISKPKALAKAVGEGIYPNTGAVLKNPAYKVLKSEGRLDGNHWDFVHSDDLEAAFFKWATAPEPWGIKLYYLGLIFEKAEMYYEAIKAYHAIVVHFPQSVGWTYWQTPWYPGQAAIAKIKHILRSYPELNLNTKWMKIEVKNGFDNDISNDEVITFPGVIKKKSWWDMVLEYFNWGQEVVELKNIQQRRGNGKIQLVQYDNGHWQMLVNGRPFVIKGVTYSPTKVGQSPDKGTLVSWMYEDDNKNGLADGPYDSWVDANRNNEQDSNEKPVGDFALMKEMGANTIREYHHPYKINKELFRRMHEEYGFYVMLGDFLGKYTLGSGASWFDGTDYENEDHQKNMMASVRQMVEEFKDEPYILMWVLGNENNYGVASNADQKPEAYFKFANEVAKMIKSIDPDHPVAICNGDTLFLDIFARNTPDIDIFGANVYRGDYGFGSYWEQVADATGKPGFITEYGSPAYARHLSLEKGESAQANYHRGNWLDIEENMAGKAGGVGNALGGVVFEWTDEWWKNYEPFYHDKKSDVIGPFAGGYYYEEWFGITSQGNGRHSPFLRQIREAYYTYKSLWN